MQQPLLKPKVLIAPAGPCCPHYTVSLPHQTLLPQLSFCQQLSRISLPHDLLPSKTAHLAGPVTLLAVVHENQTSVTFLELRQPLKLPGSTVKKDVKRGVTVLQEAPPLVCDLPLVLGPFSDMVLKGHASSSCAQESQCFDVTYRICQYLPWLCSG